MKVYLIRHTAVDVPQGTCYGYTDVPLKESFLQEAQVVKDKLKEIDPDVVYSSPLTRCFRLASFCGYENATHDDRLKEMNFGDWEKQLWDDIDMSIWKNDWINPATPNGESFTEMYGRVSSFFDDLRQEDYDKVFVFTHGGVISCARVYFEQADIKETFDLMPEYGSVVKFII